MAPHDPEIRSRVSKDFAPTEDMLMQTIELGQSKGAVKSIDEARKLACLLVLVLQDLQVIVRTGSDMAQIEKNLSLLLSILD
jgi:hypothetical protein